MICWLADTNVISEVRRKQPDTKVLEWIGKIDLDCLFTTSVNIAELRFGIANQKSPPEAHLLTVWLENAVRPWFQNRILDVAEESLFRWRTLLRDLERRQLPAPAVDILIAAIALQHGLYVATRDIKPFIATGVPVLNPWTGERFNGA